MVRCCCHKSAVWASWFAGDYVSGEADAVTDRPPFGGITPERQHRFVATLETFESKVTAYTNQLDCRKAGKFLSHFSLPKP